MYKVKLLNNITSPKLKKFDKSKYEVSPDIENPDAIMLRSAKIHDMEFNKELLCIARAGAGVNNIPLDRCTQEAIVVFNTPGANAGAVKELVICSLLLASRDIIGGIKWLETIAGKGDEVPALVEKHKSGYIGPEIAGKTLGLLGLGAIGAITANAAIALDMDVRGFDPFIPEHSRKNLSPKVKIEESLDDVFANSDYISLNLPLNESTKNIICSDTIAKMKDGVRIINAARAELVCDDDMIAALGSGKVAKYVTDFPNAKTASASGVIAIPHLGASTPESEDNCVKMAANEIIEYIENGNIINSVNFCDAYLPRVSSPRLSIIHENIPEMIAKVTRVVSSFGINIDNMLNAGKKEMKQAYTIIDIDKDAPGLLHEIKCIEGVIKVRLV